MIAHTLDNPFNSKAVKEFCDKIRIIFFYLLLKLRWS